MGYQAVFKRYELKFLLSLEQKERILHEIAPYMMPDQYGKTVIRNLYFDTDNYRLIRHSIEKPVYKEKLRLRSYGREEERVFVELKKKYKSVVYKRRISMPEREALDWLCKGQDAPVESQITREIDYFMEYYQTLRPTVFLSYEREAYVCRAGSELRITFDDEIRCRRENLCINGALTGMPILPKERVLMEIKTAGGIPLWLTELLTRERIFKTSFSKYGMAYTQLIFPNQKGGYTYV